MKLRLLTSAALTAALALGASAASPSLAATKLVPTAALTSTCSTPAPTTAQGWSDLFRTLGGQWAGADQSNSVNLPDGRSMWVFGDTVQGTLTDTGGVTNWRMPHNTMAIADKGCIKIYTGVNQTSFVPDRSGTDFYWPTSTIVDNGKPYIFVSRTIVSNGTFASAGTEIAALNYTAGATPTFSRRYNTPSTGTAETAFQWGAATTQYGGYTYIYGTRRVNEPFVFGRDMAVARVPVGKLTTLSAWTYWNGTSWSTSQASAKVIHPAVGGVSTTFSMHRMANGTWVAVTKKDDYLGDKVVALTSPNPYGPFAEQVLADAPSNLDTGDVTYVPLAHPELPLASGKLLVTVNRNNTDSSKALADVERARPYFIEVAVQ